MEERAGPQELSAKIPMFCKSGDGEDVQEFCGEHGVQTSKAWRKSTLTIDGRTDAEHEEPIYWPPEAKSKITGKKLVLGKIEGRRRWLQSITDSKVTGLRKLWAIWRAGKPGVPAVHAVTKSQTRLSDWTTSKNWYWQCLGDGSDSMVTVFVPGMTSEIEEN